MEINKMRILNKFFTGLCWAMLVVGLYTLAIGIYSLYISDMAIGYMDVCFGIVIASMNHLNIKSINRNKKKRTIVAKIIREIHQQENEIRIWELKVMLLEQLGAKVPEGDEKVALSKKISDMKESVEGLKKCQNKMIDLLTEDIKNLEVKE